MTAVENFQTTPLSKSDMRPFDCGVTNHHITNRGRSSIGEIKAVVNWLIMELLIRHIDPSFEYLVSLMLKNSGPLCFNKKYFPPHPKETREFVACNEQSCLSFRDQEFGQVLPDRFHCLIDIGGPSYVEAGEA